MTERSLRPFADFFLIVLSLVASVWLCRSISYWFYPLAVLLVGSRMFALVLLGHEATHGLLVRSTRLNHFFGRWFCHFPVFVSFSHYSALHHLHHRYLGTERDPDSYIYQRTWKNLHSWFVESLLLCATGKMFYHFAVYFNGIPQWIEGKYPFRGTHDRWKFFGFWTVILTVLIMKGWMLYFFLFWLVPLIVWMPWIQVVNNCQHYFSGGPQANWSRNIIFKSKILEEILFPLNINIHDTHHRHPEIPYYRLKTLPSSKEREASLKCAFNTFVGSN